MSGSALIVANGTLPGTEIIEREMARVGCVLAADGGANRLHALGFVPDAVLGDFDSLTVDLPITVRRIHAPDQDHTDLEKAVIYLSAEGYDDITVIGATGNRLDHTFAALAIVCKYGVRLVDDIGVAQAIRGPAQISLTTRRGQVVSLMPCGQVSGLSTENLKWDLHGADFNFGERDGTSNEAIADTVEIGVAEGCLVVYAHHL